MPEPQPVSFWRCLRSSHKRQLLTTVLFAVAAAVAECSLLLYLLYLMLSLTAVSAHGADGWLGVLAVLLFIPFLKTLLYIIAYGNSHKAAYALLYDLRMRLLARLQQLPLSVLHRYGSADLKQRVIQDVEQLETSLAHHLVEAIVAMLVPLILLGSLCLLDVRLALAGVLPIVLAFAANFLLMSFNERCFTEYSAAQSRLNMAITAFVRSLPAMKIFRQDAQRFFLLREHTANYIQLMENMVWRSAPVWAVYNSLVVGSLFSIFVVGGWLYSQSHLALVHWLAALLVGIAIQRPVMKITRMSSETEIVKQAWKRIAEVLNEPVAEKGQGITDTGDVSVALKLSNISYQLSGRGLLQQLSFQLPKGSVTLLEGISGSGKSVLLELIAGLRYAQQGTVEQSGKLTLISQHTVLFAASLRDNLLLGRTVDDHELQRVLDVAQATPLLKRLPDGLDSIITAAGNNLSGGERQRIGIARALLSGADILLLDEVVAFADNRTATRFLTALRQQYPDTTLLLTSHCDLPTLHVDQRLQLDNGHITAYPDPGCLSHRQGYHSTELSLPPHA